MATVPAVERAPPGSIVPCIGRTSAPCTACPGVAARSVEPDGGMTEDVIARRARALAGALTEAGFARSLVRAGDTEIELRRAPRNGAGAAPAPAAAVVPEVAAERRADLVSSDV